MATKGWLILSMSLTVIIITLIILWISTASFKRVPIMNAKGNYGVTPGVDADALQTCGPSQTDECTFFKSNLSSCEDECENLKSICEAFTFNFGTQTMKIVDTTTTFMSPGTNLFRRQ